MITKAIVLTEEKLDKISNYYMECESERRIINEFLGVMGLRIRYFNYLGRYEFVNLEEEYEEDYDDKDELED